MPKISGILVSTLGNFSGIFPRFGETLLELSQHQMHESTITIVKDPTTDTVSNQKPTLHGKRALDKCTTRKYESIELTREKKGSQAKTLSRNMIIEMLNRTEDEIHDGGVYI